MTCNDGEEEVVHRQEEGHHLQSRVPPHGTRGRQVAGAPGSAYAHGHDSYYGESADDSSAPMSEARRREQLEYGFPDDGYDYMRHLRTLGQGRANLDGLKQAQQAQEGASTSAAAEAAEAAAAELAVSGDRQQGGASTSNAGALTAPMQSVYIKAAKVYKAEADVRFVDARHAAVGAAADTLAPGEQWQLSLAGQLMQRMYASCVGCLSCINGTLVRASAMSLTCSLHPRILLHVPAFTATAVARDI